MALPRYPGARAGRFAACSRASVLVAAVAADGITVTDTFTPVLSDIAVALDGTALALTTDYTYNTTTGAFATVPGRITVPAATFAQDATTGEFTVTPGVAVLTVTGTV